MNHLIQKLDEVLDEDTLQVILLFTFALLFFVVLLLALTMYDDMKSHDTTISYHVPYVIYTDEVIVSPDKKLFYSHNNTFYQIGHLQIE